ncbi:glutathione S-transferase family protein [Chelatococcus sp. SYSU_G07232]|uniref:Glutathione S-transferase family protein n=1 Tax=Chelatococcus albus TaxID=3047466 RepID=A0ABT7ACQ8_9HYPH|nr:glutathione S-transferase family protein [Chelatococcus sp. SYSU_G07232]MDJ1157158.1 glutathione S-transferase family protein [Chelatococcus sp. SYSU_G07232]
MITLYAFGPGFGLSDLSPFVIKAEILLKMAGLPYRTDRGGFSKAPKGKLPYIRDGERVVCDSTFIRLHLEERHDIDFDEGLSALERATGWAFEKMCEEHLYWALVSERWLMEENFAKVRAAIFDQLPWPLRTLVPPLIQRKVRKALVAQGFGRHSREEMLLLARCDIEAIATQLGDKPFMMGAAPKGVDATVHAFLMTVSSADLASPLVAYTREHANLAAYMQRMQDRFYAEPAMTEAA